MATGAGPFDVVLVDPPYDDTPLVEALLAALGGPAGTAGCAPAAVVVAKHFWRAAPPARIGLLGSTRERRFGETALTFYRRAGRREARMRVAVYPGSFDPVTFGHLDVAARARRRLRPGRRRRPRQPAQDARRSTATERRRGDPRASVAAAIPAAPVAIEVRSRSTA